MRIQTKAQYVELAKALKAKGFSVDTPEDKSRLYDTVTAAGDCIKLSEEITYEGIYKNRLLAVMHELAAKAAYDEDEAPQPLDLSKM